MSAPSQIRDYLISVGYTPSNRWFYGISGENFDRPSTRDHRLIECADILKLKNGRFSFSVGYSLACAYREPQVLWHAGRFVTRTDDQLARCEPEFGRTWDDCEWEGAIDCFRNDSPSAYDLYGNMEYLRDMYLYVGGWKPKKYSKETFSSSGFRQSKHSQRMDIVALLSAYCGDFHDALKWLNKYGIGGSHESRWTINMAEDFRNSFVRDPDVIADLTKYSRFLSYDSNTPRKPQIMGGTDLGRWTQGRLP